MVQGPTLKPRKKRYLPEDLVYYFGYGSNLLAKRLRARVKYARLVGIGKLNGYRLTFNFLAAGSGKCDIYETGTPEDVVWGAVFAIPRIFVGELDRCEGVPYNIYERKVINVDINGETKRVFTYIGVNGARWRRGENLPVDWYKHHVVLGAQQIGLPAEYQDFLRAQESRPDSNKIRAFLEESFWE